MRKKTIVCYGDSLTKGIPGFSYVDFITIAKCRNRGLGGDTLLGLKSRIESRINSINEYSLLVLAIGTNDILLPLLKNKSHIWSRVAEKTIKRGSVPTEDVDIFYHEYKELLESLKAAKILVNIPCIGEDLASKENKIADKYNHQIQRLCDEQNLIYIDINSWQKQLIKNSNISTVPYFLNDAMNTLMDTVITKMGVSRRLSNARNLVTTIDGIHFNKMTAQYLAAKIEENFKTIFTC